VIGDTGFWLLVAGIRFIASGHWRIAGVQRLLRFQPAARSKQQEAGVKNNCSVFGHKPEAEKRRHGMSEWEPKIVAFLCNWCSYGAADLAGVGRMEYPSNIRVVRIPCTGRMDPKFFLAAMREGADGVWVSG